MTSTLPNRRRGKGFTLMELMITVVIVGILAAFAYPSYQDFIRKGRRTEAKAALMENMQLFERHFSQVNTYNDTGTGKLWTGFKTYSGDNQASAKYTVSAVACDNIGQCVELRAAPLANFADPVCDKLVLRSTGEKLVMIGNANPAIVANCW